MEFALQDIVEEGLISDAQLEAVVYANMRFQTTLSGRKELTSVKHKHVIFAQTMSCIRMLP
jgi:hypothetical protein